MRIKHSPKSLLLGANFTLANIIWCKNSTYLKHHLKNLRYQSWIRFCNLIKSIKDWLNWFSSKIIYPWLENPRTRFAAQVISVQTIQTKIGSDQSDFSRANGVPDRLWLHTGGDRMTWVAHRGARTAWVAHLCCQMQLSRALRVPAPLRLRTGGTLTDPTDHSLQKIGKCSSKSSPLGVKYLFSGDCSFFGWTS